MIEEAGKKHLTENAERELRPLIECLQKLRSDGKVLVAVLYGSYARGEGHARSDIDLAVFAGPMSGKEESLTMDTILMSVERAVSLLRLDDTDESPFIIQAALKGIHLIEPDEETLYAIADRALHESEVVRHRRAAHA